ncbi:hypothetical protein GEMRC1_004236 [Eukaryota sp. GEM-RC1]
MGERREIWQTRGLSDKKCNALMFSAAVNFVYPQLTTNQLFAVKELVLVGLELSALDLDGLTGLEKLNLAKNSISTLKNSKISLCTEQIFLSQEYPSLLNQSFNLKLLGLSRNPVTEKKNYLIELLGSFELLRRLPLKMIAIDTIELDYTHVADCWSQCGGDSRQVELYRFQGSLFKHLGKFEPHHIQHINLNNHGLTLVDFSSFPSLVKLELANNKLTNESIQLANIHTLSQLKDLDMSMNSIKDLYLVACLIDELPNLERISLLIILLLNPLLDCIKRPDCKLRVIDNVELTVKDICKYSGVPAKKSSKFKIDILCYRQNVVNGLTLLDLSSQKLSSLSGIDQYPHLESIILRDNDISQISVKYLTALPHLKHLDVSYNKIKDLSVLIDNLSFSPSLSSLVLKNCTSDKNSEEFCYLETVFQKLRGVQVVDELPNSYCLNTHQLHALEFLKNFGPLSINRVTTINLEDQYNVQEHHFVAILRALAYLPVEKLNINIPQFEKIKNLRFMLIYMIPSLVELNERKVSLEEKSNAHTICSKLFKKSGVEFLKRPSPYMLVPVVASVVLHGPKNFEMLDDNGSKKPAKGPGAVGSTQVQDSSTGEGRGPTEGRVPQDDKTPGEGRGPTEGRGPQDDKTPGEGRGPTEGRGPQDDKTPGEGRGPTEGRGPQDDKTPGEGRGPTEGRGPQDDKTPGEGRGPTEGRGPQDDKTPGEGRGPQDDKTPGEGRGPQDDKTPGEGRGPQDDKTPGEGRGPTEGRGPQDDKTPGEGRGPTEGRGPQDDKTPGEGRGPTEGRGPQDDKTPGEGRGPTEGRGPQDDKTPGEGRGPQDDKTPGEGRGPTEGRGPQDDKTPGEGRGPTEGRGPQDDKTLGEEDNQEDDSSGQGKERVPKEQSGTHNEVEVDVPKFENFGEFINPAYVRALKIPFFMSLGSALTKIEIITSFFQILALLFAFSIDIEWPQFFQYYYYVSIPFSISFDWFNFSFDLGHYAKLFVFSLIPIFFTILYFVDFSHRKWTRKFVENWKSHKRLMLTSWLSGVLLFMILSITLIDFSSISLLINGEFPSSTSLGFLVSNGRCMVFYLPRLSHDCKEV